MNPYLRFLIMLSISFVIMYSVMYLNVDQQDHIYLNLSRLYMTVLMVAPMAVVMLLMMGKMYQNKKKNGMIVAGSVVLFAAALFLLRSQTPVGDVQYMKAMIPHHSSAILTSQEANISDPEVKKLAEEIIQSQIEEIEQMKKILDRME